MNKKEIREIIIATAYADGWLHGKKNKYLMFGHCEKQKNYANWKMSTICSALNIPYKSCLAKSMTSPNNNRQNFYKFWSITHHKFTAIYRRMYVQNKKIISENLLNKLGPLGLAVWFMDDGCQEKYKGKRKSFSFILGWVTHEESETFRNWLKNKFNLESKSYLSKGKYTVIKITKQQNMDNFVNIVKKYIHSDLLYKVS